MKLTICKVLLASATCLAFQMNVKAQTWTQLGPGGGGQVRAIYADLNSSGNYDFYLGSDVAGVWKAPDIAPASISDLNEYSYQYISNHEIMRFVNKFYHPSSYNSDYLFVGNGSGIHRIDRTVPDGAMEKIFALEESWVSDMYISQMYTADHRIYFVTGNTRTDDNVAGNAKDALVKDFYYGTLTPLQNSVIATGMELEDLDLTQKRNVFCLYTEEHQNSNQADDEFYVGSEYGLYHFDYSSIPNSGPPIAGPTTANLYKVTSITPVYNDPNLLLITIYGEGLFEFNRTSLTWTPKISPPMVAKQIGNGGGTQNFLPGTDIDNFSKMLTLYDNAGVPNGYLLCTDHPDITNFFTGVFHCGVDGNNLPDGVWTSLNTLNNASNEYGWNSSKPCSNINSALIITDNVAANNTLMIGKSGVTFVSKLPVTGTSVNWQQIYTNTASTTPLCGNYYNNIGLVGTSSKSVFPDPFLAGRTWLGDFDRWLWISDPGTTNFAQVKSTSSLFCPSLNSANGNPTCTGSISDCHFITNNSYDNGDPSLYCGISQGFAGSKGSGFVFQLANSTSLTWQPIGNVMCGDPIKLIFDHAGGKYILFKDAISNDNDLFFLNSGTWTLVDLGFGATQNLADVLFDKDDNLFVILADGVDKGVYKFSGPQATWNTQNNFVPLLHGITCNKLGYYYDPTGSLPYSYVICGASGISGPASNLVLIDPNNLNTTTDINNCIQLQLGVDIFQNLAVDGVTSISVNLVTKAIYVATVKNDGVNLAAKSHIFQGAYDQIGNLMSCWKEISGNLPNKSLVFSAASNNTGSEVLYASSRGLGEWKSEICNLNVNLTPTNATCYGDGSIAAIADCGFGNYSFSWSTNPVQTSATATGLSPGTYTVSVTDQNGFTSSASATITSSSTNCCLPGFTDIDQTNFTNGSTISGPHNLNTPVIVNSFETIIINGADIRMSPGVSITVSPNAFLTIQNASTLSACGDMWRGIINDGGTVSITSGSSVNDAIEALSNDATNNPAEFHLTDATFDHNYTSVVLRNGDYGTSSIEGSTFNCSGGYIGKAPFANYLTLTHIHVENVVNFKIGNAAGGASAVNYINNAYIGIAGYTSDFDVENNHFDFPPMPYQIVKHKAIYCSGSLPTVYSNTVNIGGSVSQKNIFNNWYYSVYALYMRTVNASFNDFADNEKSCYVNRTRSITLFENNFERCTRGIDCYDNEQSTININFNHFNEFIPYDLNDYGYEAIRVEGIYFSLNPVVTITNNQIYNNQIGIHLRYVDGATVSTNYYQTDMPNTDITDYHYGIWNEYANGSRIGDNIIQRNGNTSGQVQQFFMRGIAVDNSRNCRLNSNLIQYMGSGIRLLGGLKGTELHCNSMKFGYTGTYFDLATLTIQGTAPNDAWDNFWYLNTALLKCEGTYTQTIDWYNRGTDFNSNDFSPKDFTLGLIQTYPNKNPTCTPPAPPDDDKRDEVFGDILNNGANYQDYTEENLYFDKQNFYSEATENSSLLNLGTPEDLTYQNKYDQIDQTNVALFYEVQDLVQQGNTSLAASRNLLITPENAIETNTKTVNSIYFDKFIGTIEDLSQYDIVVLENIANQLSIAGGEAVYRARAMLRIDVHETIGYSPYRKSNTEESKQMSSEIPFGKFQPLPAKNLITYTLTNPQENILKMIIYDQFGEEVMQTSILPKQISKQIDIKSLATGVYVVTVLSDGNLMQTDKLTIIK
ncbi:MAG TPA: T9SS type A sorting domain-containing protein [Bacteroidia bacterium]|nr:T9SS type A sorting domain-containing protein [Bacteroidia bacterium]